MDIVREDAQSEDIQSEDTDSQVILVVDDQQTHVEIIEQVLNKEESCFQIVTLPTASEAIAYLRNRAQYTLSQRPDLVLINLNLQDGKAADILTEIKTDATLRQIPVIVLSEQATDTDVLTSYQQRCNCFVMKPQDLTSLRLKMQAIKSFWLSLVTLPAK